MLRKALIVLVFAVLAGLLSVSERAIDRDHPTIILGDMRYDMDLVKAPVLTGPALTAFTWVATSTPFGHAIRRFLLLDNGVTKLRELAAQMGGLPPLYYPMERMDETRSKAWSKAQAAAQAASLTMDDIFKFPPQDHPLFNTEQSDVVALHEAFKAETSTTPTTVASKILEAFPALQDKYRPFSSYPLLGDIEAAARASTERYAQGTPLSVWDGVPVALKDMVQIRGYEMSDGSASNVGVGGNRTDDDLLVERFRELGAIILPPTTMTEGGVTPVGYSTYVQGSLNPYDPTHYSGGSSAGSAVAVALGLCPISIGFDGGGSIRTPASLSGVYGLATGLGRLPFSSHTAGTLIKAGPFARKVADLALAYSVLARHSPEHNFYGKMYNGVSVPEPLLNELLIGGGGELEGMTLGVFEEWFEDASEEVVRRNKEVIAELVKKGATVKTFKLPNMQHARMSHAIKITSEFAIAWDGPFSENANLEPATRVTVGLGSASTSLEVLAAEKMRRYFSLHVESLFRKEGIDAIVTPTTPLSAPRVPEGLDWETGESNTPLTVDLLKFVFVGNFLGLPGVACPVGFDKTNDDMPLSILFTGQQWEGEGKVMKLAAAVDEVVRERGWKTREVGDKLKLL